MNGEPSNDESGRSRDQDDVGQEGPGEVFARGVRTALRNNATAYGFSISITASYGLASSANGSPSAGETVAFAVGAAVAFVLIGAVFLTRYPQGSLREGGQIATISGGIDLLAVLTALGAAYGLSQVPGFVTWPLTSFGTAVAYLLVSGLDVLIARAVADHTSFGRAQ